jgi:hypothetical protein
MAATRYDKLAANYLAFMVKDTLVEIDLVVSRTLKKTPHTRG